jgi:hypothetical protein
MNFGQAIQWVGGDKEAVMITQRDLWRNVRLPLLHILPTYDKNLQDWHQVPSDQISQHSSLISVPIRGFPSATAGNMTFVMGTNYQALEVGLRTFYVM